MLKNIVDIKIFFEVEKAGNDTNPVIDQRISWALCMNQMVGKSL